ncbi:Endoglucanase 8 [Spatholobus suberectus]|nr:Endoglucanase 8 [Spatholobus suberectus]
MSRLSSLVTFTIMVMATMTRATSINYAEALAKSILFFEGQRSGKLPPSQRMKWRKDSALNDGFDIHINMIGGYYEAGDNVKFNFPMAFTTTMLAWSVLEFGDLMGLELQNALEAIQWGTDYFLKATKFPYIVVAQVGNPVADHNCWERPEDMDTPRTSYFLSPKKPGSEVSAEIAAALAASSIAFRRTDARYSKLLLYRAMQVFHFANKNRGSYNNSVGAAPSTVILVATWYDFHGHNIHNFCTENLVHIIIIIIYQTQDELIWGAAWLYEATNMPKYRNFVKANIQSMGGNLVEFGWDSKHAGIYVLVSQVCHLSFSLEFANLFIPNADKFICSLLPTSPTKSVSYSKGGLLFRPGGSNLQHTTALSFLLIVYARYMHAAKKAIPCENEVADPARLINLAKSQVDYILGNNPQGMSYMVGYGHKFPQKIHHRGSTLPSMDLHPQHLGCRDGDQYFKTEKPNPNVLTGAVVGGPAEDDSFQDSRYNVGQSEPTTYINAPFVGVLAYFNKPIISFTQK